MELLNLLFVLTFITASFPEKMFNTEAYAKINYFLPKNVEPRHYKIKLGMDTENYKYHGISNVSIIIHEPTYRIFLHSINLKIIEPVTIEKLALGKSTKQNANISHLTEQEMITFHFNYKLPSGIYILNMEFMGNICDTNDRTCGFFRTWYIDRNFQEKFFFATPNWVTGIRRTFPCWDEPGLKATFSIIVSHHVDYKAFINALESKISSFPHNIAQTYFNETLAIPTYLITIGLCNMTGKTISEDLHLKSRKLSVVSNELIFAGDVIVNVTRYFQKEWNESSAFSQDHFAVPGFIDDGMAKSGLTLYR